jgi:SAM-dependent methyltransferase
MDGDPARERASIVARLALRTSASGRLSGPCIPTLCDEYFGKVLKLFEAIDRPLTGDRLEQFRDAFRRTIERGFSASPYTQFLLTYGPVGPDGVEVRCDLSLTLDPLEQQYQRWMANPSAASRPFGVVADAKVIDVAARLRASPDAPDAGPARVLDVGAGTGRNALALAGLGLAVDAIEPVPALADALAAEAAQRQLAVNVIRRDVLRSDTALAPAHYRLVVLSEVVTHFSHQKLAALLPKLVRSLTVDGTLLFNAFLSKDGYQPGPEARQVAEVAWSTFFSRTELTALTEQAGLRLVQEEPCVAYEQARQPAAAWPPTPWYVAWAHGHNIFDEASGPTPIELHWLEFRRASSRP